MVLVHKRGTDFVQFPFSLPANFEAVTNRQFFCRIQVTRLGILTPTFLQGITPTAGGANNWNVLNEVARGAYDVQNAAQLAGTRPPPSVGVRSVIEIYLEEVEVGNNPARLSQPGNELVAAALPQTPIGEFIIIAQNQTQHNVLASILFGAETEPPYIRSGFVLDQHEPFFSYPSGFSSYMNIEIFDELPQYLPLLIQDSQTTFLRTTAELNRCVRVDSGELQFDLLGKAKLGYYLRNDVNQNDKSSSIVRIPIPLFENQKVRFTALPLKLDWYTQYGMPDLLMIRVKQIVLVLWTRKICFRKLMVALWKYLGNKVNYLHLLPEISSES